MKRLLSIALIAFSSPAWAIEPADAPWRVETPEQLCEKSRQPPCHGNCLDGWFKECFFDSRGRSLAKWPKNEDTVCLGLRSLEQCKPCKNEFKLKNGKRLKDVGCLEFYRTIQEKDQGCKGCIQRIFTGS